MYNKVGLPRVKTMFSVVGVLLFCTFYWDLIALHRLPSSRQGHPSLHHGLRMNDSFILSWRCVTEDQSQSQLCQRYMSTKHSKGSMSFATCSMTCSPTSRLWPLPTGDMKIANNSSTFHPHQLKINFTKVNDPVISSLLKNMTALFHKRIANLSEKSHAHTSITQFLITVQSGKSSKNYRYKLNTDESYKVIVKRKGTTVTADVKASTFLGLHHGLETLSQLIWWDERHQVLNVLDNVVISDSPSFSYRGLLLDTGRNFIPIPFILRTIDAMSMNKLNVFHWHMTDSKSFPFASKKYPGFKKYGPYSVGKVYSTSDVQQVVEYSLVRGVTVVVEIGALSNAGEGWEWGKTQKKGNLSLCMDSQPFTEFCYEPPCGKLNPANENSTLILARLIAEVNNLTKANLMHIGGVDVDFRCWENSAEVTRMKSYMKNGIFGVSKVFFNNFMKKLSDTTTTPNLIMWYNDLMDDAMSWKKQFHSSVVVQSKGPSTSNEVEKLIHDKYQVIVSSSDLWSVSYPNILLAVYLHRPWADLKSADKKLVVGGEACAWTDGVDHHSLDATLWPATSAVAERLWSDPSPSLTVIDRLAWFRDRMVKLGIMSSPVGPQWCLYNPSQCL